MTTAIQEYSKTEAALAELGQRYKGVVYNVVKPEEMAVAKEARREIRTYRVALEKMRVTLKADVLERGRMIDGEAKRITAGLEALENPIDEQIKKEEKRIEDIRLAKVREEQARIEAEERARKEAEEAKMAAERAEIARRQAELDRAEAERKAIEDDLRRQIEEAHREARLKIEEEERQARLAREEADRAARQAREAEEEKIEAERRELERQRYEAEAQQRKARAEDEAREKAARDAEEERQREIRRAQAEKMDARGMLITFVSKYGKIEEFGPVVAAINKYLKITHKEAA